jgi:hypothetical protein
MVVVAAMGLRGTDHSVQIPEVRRSGNTLIVQVRETRPRPGGPMNSAAGWPTAAVVIGRENLRVPFQDVGTDGGPLDPRMMPLSGATVQAFRETRNGNNAGWVNAGSARTDAQGAFQFQNLPTGNYFLRVSRHGYRNADLRASTNGQALTVQMTPESARPLTVPPRSRNAPELVSIGDPSAPAAGPGGEAGAPTPGPARNLSLLGFSLR